MTKLGSYPNPGEFDPHPRNQLPFSYSWCVRRSEEPEDTVRSSGTAPYKCGIPSLGR